MDLKTKIIGGSLAGILAASAAVVAKWEGYSAKPYRDIVGVLTVCYGNTVNVQNRTYTRAECDAALQTEIGKHLNGLSKCVKVPMQVNQWVALTSWTYNVGIGAACGSTLVRKVNAGASPAQFCPHLDSWVYAGGKRVKGLVNRRAEERKICEGVSR